MSYADVESGGGRGYQSGRPLGSSGGGGGGSGDYAGVYRQAVDVVTGFSQNVAKLQRLNQSIGTKKDNDQLHALISETSERARSQARDGGRLLKQLSQMKAGDAAEADKRKVQEQKLQSDLKKQLALFQDIQVNTKKQTRTALVEAKATLAFQKEEEAAESSPLLKEQRNKERERVQIMAQEIEFNEELISAREESIIDIENQITEVNEIFRDLASLVNEQGEMLGTIEDHIESAVDNVTVAHAQVVQANKYQKSARNKLCCLFVIAAVIAAGFAVFFVLSHK